MNIKDIDHLTITAQAKNMDALMRFYHEVFDLPVIEESKQRLVLQLGHQKLLFVTDHDEVVSPAHPQSGAIQFCVIAKDSLEYVANHLVNYGVDIIKGPIKTTGANGPMNALFVHDPEQNVIEICEYRSN